AGAGVALPALAALLAAPTVVDYFHGFAYRYDAQLTTLAVFDYIPPSDIVGITPFNPDRHAPVDAPWALPGMAALIVLMIAGLTLAPRPRAPAGLIHTGFRHDLRVLRTLRGSLAGLLEPPRVRWLGLLLGALAYLAWLRWWQSYPYAYMKGAAYIGFVFTGLAAAGWQALASRGASGISPRASARGQETGDRRPETGSHSYTLMAVDSRLRSRVSGLGHRWLADALALVLLAALGLSQGRVLAAHWEQPGLYPGELPALLALREQVPAGSSVTLTSHPAVQGPTSGLAAYLLDHAAVLGYVRTGYWSSGSGAPDAIGAYGLLQADEDPAPWGYGELVWRGGSYALYRRPAGTLAHLRLGRVLAPGESLALAVGAGRLAVASDALPGGGARQFTLALAAIEPGVLLVGGAAYQIPAGGAQLRLPALATPQALELRNGGTAPLLLRSATLAEASDGAAAVTPSPGTLVAQASAAAEGTEVAVELEALAADAGPVALALDIWDAPRGVQYGWYGVRLDVRPEPQRLTLQIDLASGAARGRGAGGELPIGASFRGLRPGDYVARLYAAAGPLALSVPAELFAFHVDGAGAVRDVRLAPPTTLAAGLARPRQALDATVGEDVRLLGYTLATPEVRPGEAVECVLWWRAERGGLDARSVLVHLLDAGGERVAQGDGPPGEGARPTEVWQAGELVLDPRRVEVPADLPPGDYTLAVGMYRWPSLERLELTRGGTRQDGDVIRIPVRVVR
ncbi:MAG TPA: hypothetical protein VNL77_12185, partial [Roseiflexaceae bacterium]|nr:hypothetical protein [Roseiflexaceae bacterium]